MGYVLYEDHLVRYEILLSNFGFGLNDNLKFKVSSSIFHFIIILTSRFDRFGFLVLHFIICIH